MTRILAPAILALTLVAAPASAETRNLSGFTGVQARDGVEVAIAGSTGFRVEVTGRDASRVRTVVENGTLKISRANRSWWGGGGDLDATVRVTLPRLAHLSAARGAQVQAANISAGDIEISAAMGGVIEISGACNALDASVAMGGVLDADAFQCATADVSASMGGVAEVYATNTFDASASMGGSIDISGAARGDTSASMGGSIDYGH